MRKYTEFAYTSGFTLTGDELIELAKYLNVPYAADAPQAAIRRVNAARFISLYMSKKDELLEPFNLQIVPLIKVRPGTYGHPDPEVNYIIPTMRSRNKYDIDPNTHENTQKVKSAVIATGIPEEYLSRFQTYPNKEYPWSIVEILPPPIAHVVKPPANSEFRPKFPSFSEFCENYDGESDEETEEESEK